MVSRFGLYVGVALLSSVAIPAYAGFEFVAPINQGATNSAPRQAPVSSDPIMEQSDVEPFLPLMPKKVDVVPLSTLPVETKPVVSAPIIERDLPPAMPKPMAIPSSVASQSDVVQGFANQVPLVIALQQIIPAQYQYAFADGVNPGTKVDWQGGKAWDQVVNDMVADQGMVVDVSGNVVYIRRQGSVTQVPTRRAIAPIASKPAMVSNPPKELLGRANPVPLLSSGDMAPRVKGNVKSSILFDSPENAELSGISNVQQVKQPVIQSRKMAQSNRLELSDLSIGQPMDLMPRTEKKSAPIIDQPRNIVENKKILTAPSIPVSTPREPASLSPVIAPKAPVFTETVKPEDKVSILPKTAPVAMAPVRDKKILLLDNMPTSPVAVQPKVNQPKVADPVMLEAVDLSATLPPIQELPVADRTALSEDMMSFMKPNTVTPSVLKSSADWKANSGETLRSVLQDWADEAGTSLIWKSNYDYPLQTDIEISGSFENAVRIVLDGLADATPRPMGRLHRNQPTGQPVLVIETADLTN